MVATSNLSFSTILAARTNDGRPTDLEVLLRPHCHKLKVVERLHGRAHLLFPKLQGCSNSLAVRVVDECDLVPPNDRTNSTMEEQLSVELQSFMEAFPWTVILFVLPTRGVELLNDPKSLFHSVQSWTSKLADTNTARVIGVPTPTLALEALFSMIQALTKQNVRQTFWKRQQVRYFVEPSEECRTDTAEHVFHALERWGERFEVPPGDLQVSMSIGGTLQEIVDRAVTPGGLDELPVEERTKHVVRAFFGSSTSRVSSNSLPLPVEQYQMGNDLHGECTKDSTLDMVVHLGNTNNDAADDAMETGTEVPTYSGGWRTPQYPSSNLYPPPPPGLLVQQQQQQHVPMTAPYHHFGAVQHAPHPMMMQPWGNAPPMIMASMGPPRSRTPSF
eukprot:Nitzschia sp. Nitz4//scaffold175_size95217//78713//80063//NITZ4_004735-RA/size95217-augustus-gene-0.27-mRNA-1//-1//CDS//3329538975//4053//frame0